MVSLKHPNVLPLIGVCFEKSGGSSTDLGPLIVMPFMKNGDVQSYLRNLREKADMESFLSAVRVFSKIGFLRWLDFCIRES